MLHDLAHSLDRDVLGDGIEGLNAVDVPAGGRREYVAAPLLVGDGLGLCVVGRPAEMNLQVQRSPTAGHPVGIDHPAQISRSALTVISPSAQAAHQRAVATLTAAPSNGGGSDGRVHTRARSTRTSPS